MNLNKYFNNGFLFGEGIRKFFFDELNVSLKTATDKPIDPVSVFKEFPKERLSDIKNVFFAGRLSDFTFKTEGDDSSLEQAVREVASGKYNSILVFGIELKTENPTRSRLSEITRWLNRKSLGAPVTVIFGYSRDSNFSIAFTNSERTKYQQQWREGEKVGKVSILRDINVSHPHRGHIEILEDLKIPTTGRNAVNSFESLYTYWQEVFSVSVLNKKFYKELQSWYFWAIKEVVYPNSPSRNDFDADEKFEEAIKEHKGKNVIRLLTRILFVWFIKEKKLIPDELFEEKAIAEKMLYNFTPQKPKGLFATGKQSSQYYRAILQNLFFATLNQEMGKRDFRGEGQHQNVTNLMRYESYFKNPGYFVKLMEEVVPFLNGGLFECLDKPHPTTKGKQGGDKIVYNDGFSDKPDNLLEVPDYLFFDIDEEVDLSDNFEDKIDKKTYKNAKTRGLLEILKSYKFTITENTPLEEDVALDPELLGKVFENLLASYNPETKTTARKQTGSFYTPREIVNYMVDESLIAYLKNSLVKSGLQDELLDTDLHALLAYEDTNPFEGKTELEKHIINALDQCTILDPACGSGAFPMGILQKMVHILHKVDPNNIEWKSRQLVRVDNAIKNLEEIDDVKFREQSIKELIAQKKDIEEAFANNELDYGRKLYLIENCIYGVDIQPIATQISKLRFFISLIVDQKIDKTKDNSGKAKDNFGIRPLPNLETKFVAANTLIGIKNPTEQLNLLENQEVKKLEVELKKVRHRLFNAKTPNTKRNLRDEDKTLRKKIAAILIEEGWGNETAHQLAGWDPYDQNQSSQFFSPEWMFDMKEGFNVIIGNPPFISIQRMAKKSKNDIQNQKYKTFENTGDVYTLFYERGQQILRDKGILAFITSRQWMQASYGKSLRKFLTVETNPIKLIDFGQVKIFEGATVFVNILLFEKTLNKDSLMACLIPTNYNIEHGGLNVFFDKNKQTIKNLTEGTWAVSNSQHIVDKIAKVGKPIKEWKEIEFYAGIKTACNDAFHIQENQKAKLISQDPKNAKLLKPMLRGKDIKRYNYAFENWYLINTHNGVREFGLSRIDVVKDYPRIFEHLQNWQPQLEERLDKGEHWTNLRNCAFLLEFDKPKIVWMEISDCANYAYDDKGMYLTNSAYFLSCNSEKVSLKYLLAVLNSKVADFYFSLRTARIAGGRMRYTKQFVEQIPVPAISINKQALYINLVNHILEAKKDDTKSNTSLFERKIDELIYKLYKLTYEDVKVIDPDFWLSEEEYFEVKIE